MNRAFIGKILISALLSTAAASALNINLTTKYGDTGGIVGPLNQIGDKVNGIDICPADPTVGCDFNANSGYSNNNTVEDPTDDTYNGDLLIRTNDAFGATAGWTWAGTTSDEQKVTISSTLPVLNGQAYYEFMALPGFCDAEESSISADKQSVVCVRKDFNIYDSDAYSEDLTFNVRVKGSTPPGTQPGEIKFKLESADGQVKEDSTEGTSLTVTAAPRWNVDEGVYGTYVVRKDIDGDGVEDYGHIVDFYTNIEVDEVDGTTNTAPASLGNEALGASIDFTITKTVNLTPNAIFLGCTLKGRYLYNDGFANYGEPVTYASDGARYNDPKYDSRRLLVDTDVSKVDCTRNGNDVTVNLTKIDATLSHYPTLSWTGATLPNNRAIALITTASYFIPMSDVEASDNDVVDLTSTVSSFDPNSESGNSNFGEATESTLDNSATTKLTTPGGWATRYLGYSTGPYNVVGSGPWAGNMFVNAGFEFSTFQDTVARTDYDQEKLCSVFDANRLKVQAVGDNQNYTGIQNTFTGEQEWPFRFVVYRDSADYTDGNFELYNNAPGDSSKFPYIVEYGWDYEDKSFLPSEGGSLTTYPKDQLTAECNAPSTKWTTDFNTAKSNSAWGVTKVRFTLKEGIKHPAGANGRILINHKVRDVDLKTGNAIVPEDEIVMYGAQSINGAEWNFDRSTYTPNEYPDAPTNANFGDRVIYSGPKARIIKSVNSTSVLPNSDVEYTLNMTFTNSSGLAEKDTLSVVDVLPKGLTYKTGTVTASYGEPSIGNCNDVSDLGVTCVDGENQVLKWIFDATANQAITDIVYSAHVDAYIQSGVKQNNVKVEATKDLSLISQRDSAVGITISNPTTILIKKSTIENVDYPSPRERTTTAKEIKFLVDLRNGTTESLSNLDVIDILPFIGDGDDDAILFNDLKLKREEATTYHGSLAFNSVSLTANPATVAVCNATNVKYYYTNADPKTINIAPSVTDENKLDNVASIWCEGDSTGANGCTIASRNFTFSSNNEITAVRAVGAIMEGDAMCQLKVDVTVQDNLAGDNYTNSAGASATGVTLPVLSNSLAVLIVGSSLGDYVWYDRNKNGIQDSDETGLSGVKVSLLDGSGVAVKNPANPTEDYVVTTSADGVYGFAKLNHGNYIVAFEKPSGYKVTTPNSGESTQDSNIDQSTLKSAVVALEVQSDDNTIDAGFIAPIISGHIFVDGNGDGTVGEVKPFTTYDGTQLYVTLLDENGMVLSSKAVNADGTYSFDGEDNVSGNSTFSVVLSTQNNATTSTLPSTWNSADGEHIGTGAGLDNAVDGKIVVVVVNDDVPEVNFGINKQPVAENVTTPIQFNPGKNIQVLVGDLNVSDLEDGTPTTVTIKSLPSNGVLHYNGAVITGEMVIENFNPSYLKVDPDSGDQTVVFNYTTTDKVGVESEMATVTIPFKDLKISGHLFNDGNGDGNINGTSISSADGTQLYVTLVEGGTAVASMPLTGGAYEFDIEDGVKANSSFEVILSDVSQSTNASLPTDWSNRDGEKSQNSQSNGNDGSADGQITVNVVTSDVPNNDFGINKKPDAENIEEPLQVNPGSSATVEVPDLNISDNETDANLTVTITGLPANATVYYNGEEVVENQVIPEFNNLLLTIDPDAGEQDVEFTYTVTDGANVTSDEATVKMSFANIVILGKLFNDGNGDGNINGTPTNSADETPLYVSLVDANGTLISTKPLGSDGSYLFESVDELMPNRNYMVILTDINNTKTPSLPTEWTNRDGEMVGLSGVDGDADGIVYVSLAEEDIENINFGINKRPKAIDKSEATQSNPGSTTEVAVPTLEVSDKEDGVPTTVVITQLPTNGTLYYDGVAVELDKNITNVDTSKFTFDPNDGDLTALFKYKSVDNAGVASVDATVTMVFTDLKISGQVFNDGNGDNTINGTPISQPNNEQLYATLVDANGIAVASKALDSDGSYTFGNSDGVFANSSYSIVLSINENGTEGTLPTDWTNFDGEHIGTDAGTDGTPNGKIEVAIERDNIVEVNFGINKKPVSGDATEPLQLNPGTNVQVDVPTLSLSDKEDITPSMIKVTTLPTNGTLYYDGVAVVLNQPIENFDNSKLMLDPDNGDQTVTFTYVSVDDAGANSLEATVMMSFDGLEINGNIFNDGDNNGTVDGVKISDINGTSLYATLLETNGTVMATTVIEADGSYGFDGTDGIVPNSDYRVILSTIANATVAKLPEDWNNADGEAIGVDGTLDDNADGQIFVSVAEVDVNEVNFGVNARPTANNKREIIQINPSSTTQVAVPALEIADREDGTPTTVQITKLPTNGTLYYNGNAVEVNQTIENVEVNKFTIDPDNGNIVTIFNYVSIDVTGYVSKEAQVAMPFDGLTISGTVFVDGNGDFEINGDKLTSRYGLNLFATLIDANDVVVASVPVDGYGNYLFDDKVGIVPSSDYTIVLSDKEASPTQTLPSDWEYTHPGKIRVAVGVSDKVEQNFGINGQPVVSDVLVNQVNPNGTKRVAIPELNIENNEDGTTRPTTVTIETLPTEGTLYYNGKEVTEGEVIENFNNALLTLDPKDGEVRVEFTYTVEDDAGFKSEPAKVIMEFSDTDTDGDGIFDAEDLDDDNDGILDTIEEATSVNIDTDGDGIPDRLDLDSDGDGILDSEEGSVDTDSDGKPDFQDVDSDNDGLSDLVEGGTDATLDANADGILDDQKDSDGDGIADVVDADNGGTPASTPDTDGDGIDNYRDLDSDGDGILDVIEIGGTDTNDDGKIDTENRLISGMNLPDEDGDTIPDVLDIKLKDDIKTAPAGSVVTMNLVENDSTDVDVSSIELLIPKDFNGTARVSEDGKSMIVDGEGEWSVDANGILTFVPEDGFTGTPTPIAYRATGKNSDNFAVAGISITVADVAGVTTDEVCEAYDESTVSIFSGYTFVLMLLLTIIFAAMLIRKED